MYICIHMFRCASTHLRICNYMIVHTYIYVSAHIYMYGYVYTFMLVCGCIWSHTCKHGVHMYIYAHTVCAYITTLFGCCPNTCVRTIIRLNMKKPKINYCGINMVLELCVNDMRGSPPPPSVPKSAKEIASPRKHILDTAIDQRKPRLPQQYVAYDVA